MTYNEFKFCCMMFTKAFEGKKYGEVVEGCYSYDKDCVITFEDIALNDNGFGYGENKLLFIFGSKNLIIHIECDPNIYIKSTEDFLNYFKIPLEDIV